MMSRLARALLPCSGNRSVHQQAEARRSRTTVVRADGVRLPALSMGWLLAVALAGVVAQACRRMGA